MSKKFKGLDDLRKFYEQNIPDTAYLVTNKTRYDEVKKAIDEIYNLIYEASGEASCNVAPDPLVGTAVLVEIIVDTVIIEDTKKFSSALSKADNFEVSTKSNGNIEIGIVFHDVFSPAPPHKPKK